MGRRYGGRQPDPHEHGTRKGYRQHLINKDEPCDECRAAENEYQRDRYANRVENGTQAELVARRAPRITMALDPAILADFLDSNRAKSSRARAELREMFEIRVEAFVEDHGKARLAEARKRRAARIV